MEMQIEWKNPPESEAPRNKWAKVVKLLKTRPNEWAFVGQIASQPTASILKKRYGVEAEIRKAENGQFDLYLMWPSDN